MRLTALVLIFLAGLLLRLDAAWQGAEENLPDSAAYERLARGLAETGDLVQIGQGTPDYVQPSSNYSPGLPLFAGAVFAVGGDRVRVARLLLALIASLSIPLAFLLGKRFGGDPAGLVGAAVVAFYPTLIEDSGMLLTEPLAGTLLAAAVLLLLEAGDRPGYRLWVAAGLVLGLTAMVRPEYLPISILLAVAAGIAGRVFGQGPPGRSSPLGPLIMLGCVLLVVLPWTIRNVDQYGRFIPISTGGGQTLFTGSYLPSNGDPQEMLPELYRTDPEIFPPDVGDPAKALPEEVLANLAARDEPGLPVDEALAKLGRQQYFDAATGSPLALAGMLFNKAQRIWWRGRSSLTDPLAGRLLHWAIVILSLVGLIGIALTRRRDFTITFTLLLSATAIGVVFVASPRRALVLWPVVSALAGTGLVVAASFLSSRSTRREGPVALP